MPSDVAAALAEQNIQAAPGSFGEQSNVAFEYVMRYKGSLKRPKNTATSSSATIPKARRFT